MVEQLKVKDQMIGILERKHSVTSKKQAEIKEKMLEVNLFEKNLTDLNTHYVRSIRKIFSHYCISLSNLIVESEKIKKLHQSLNNNKISFKKIQIIISQS